MQEASSDSCRIGWRTEIAGTSLARRGGAELDGRTCSLPIVSTSLSIASSPSRKGCREVRRSWPGRGGVVLDRSSKLALWRRSVRVASPLAPRSTWNDDLLAGGTGELSKVEDEGDECSP
jgi:hypothetical protein